MGASCELAGFGRHSSSVGCGQIFPLPASAWQVGQSPFTLKTTTSPYNRTGPLSSPSVLKTKNSKKQHGARGSAKQKPEHLACTAVPRSKAVIGRSQWSIYKTKKNNPRRLNRVSVHTTEKKTIYQPNAPKKRSVETNHIRVFVPMWK